MILPPWQSFYDRTTQSFRLSMSLHQPAISNSQDRRWPVHSSFNERQFFVPRGSIFHEAFTYSIGGEFISPSRGRGLTALSWIFDTYCFHVVSTSRRVLGGSEVLLLFVCNSRCDACRPGHPRMSRRSLKGSLFKQCLSGTFTTCSSEDLTVILDQSVHDCLRAITNHTYVYPYICVAPIPLLGLHPMDACFPSES